MMVDVHGAMCNVHGMPSTELSETWGAAIRARRKAAGLSIARLGARSDVEPGHLSRIERGLVVPGDEIRIRIAQELGVRVEELFAYPDTSGPSAVSA